MKTYRSAQYKIRRIGDQHGNGSSVWHRAKDFLSAALRSTNKKPRPLQKHQSMHGSKAAI